MKSLVNIKKDNMCEYYLQHLQANMNRFNSMQGIIGVTLNGGLSRGYGDHLSEVDVTVYFDDDTYEKYKTGEFQFKSGICKIDGELYDIKVVNYSSERKREWSPIIELWDLSYAEVLYDPHNKIEELFNEKLTKDPIMDHINGCMFDAWWHYKLAGDIWIYREDAVQGHLLLNEAAKSLTKALYIANRQYVPHDKWLVHFLHNLNWLPMKKEDLLRTLYSTGDLSLDSLCKRQKDLDNVWQSINDYIIVSHFPELPVDITKINSYKSMEKLLKKDCMSIQEFVENFGASSIHCDPISAIITIEDNEVLIDKEKLFKLDDKSMYQWQYSVVKAIRGNI